MPEIKVTIPESTLLKMLLRGVLNLSFVDQIQKEACRAKIGKRKGIKTLDGIVTYFERISDDEVVVLTAYYVGRENESIGSRAVALSGLLTNIIRN